MSRLEGNERGRDETRHGRSEGKKGGTKRAEEGGGGKGGSNRANRGARDEWGKRAREAGILLRRTWYYK